MFKKLITNGLTNVIITIGMGMYSYPMMCTKMRIMDTNVLLLSDYHTGKHEVLPVFKRQIDESNNILQEWIQKLSHDSEETLFLLEADRLEFHEAEDPIIHEVYSKRGDTLLFLKDLAKIAPPTSNVRFKYADRRCRTRNQVFIRVELLVRIIESEISKRVAMKNPSDYQQIKGLEGIAPSLSDPNLMKELSFLRQINRYHPINGESPESSINQFLDDMVEVISELEECKSSYESSMPQYHALGCYLEKINNDKRRLEAFFDAHLPDRTVPLLTAFLDLTKRTQSLQPWIELRNATKEEIFYSIADAGFFIDVTNAIRSGARNIVLYAGSAHHFDLSKNLTAIYGKSIIMDEVITPSASDIHSGLGPEEWHGIPPDDLRRILGL